MWLVLVLDSRDCASSCAFSGLARCRVERERYLIYVFCVCMREHVRCNATDAAVVFVFEMTVCFSLTICLNLVCDAGVYVLVCVCV